MSAHPSHRAAGHGINRNRASHGNARQVLCGAPILDAQLTLQQSPAFMRTVDLCRMYAPTRRPIVFVGPIGVGKSTLARLVHQWSGRSGRFVAISAGELSDSLAQSILFGHMRGAFTGAIERRTGVFESAVGGTLLLDDIANLSTYVQNCLLRVLEDRAFTPIGAVRDIPVTCRELYAATKPLDALAERGTIVPDFLSRAGDLIIEIPPLSERPEDVLPLANHLLVCAADEFEWETVQLSDQVCDLFLRYHWPHNIRELKGIIERAVIHARDEGAHEITPDHLPARLVNGVEQSGPARRLTPELVRKTLEETGGNRSEAARRLGVHRNALYRHAPAGGTRRTLSVDEP